MKMYVKKNPCTVLGVVGVCGTPGIECSVAHLCSVQAFQLLKVIFKKARLVVLDEHNDTQRKLWKVVGR